MGSDDNRHQLIMDMLHRISEAQEDAKDSVMQLDKKVDLHIQKTEFELKKINELDEIQNRLLDQHIQGVNTLKRWCDQHEEHNKAQFDKLEQPYKWAAITVKLILMSGAIASALVALLKFLKHI